MVITRLGFFLQQQIIITMIVTITAIPPTTPTTMPMIAPTLSTLSVLEDEYDDLDEQYLDKYVFACLFSSLFYTYPVVLE